MGFEPAKCRSWTMKQTKVHKCADIWKSHLVDHLREYRIQVQNSLVHQQLSNSNHEWLSPLQECIWPSISGWCKDSIIPSVDLIGWLEPIDEIYNNADDEWSSNIDLKDWLKYSNTNLWTVQWNCLILFFSPNITIFCFQNMSFFYCIICSELPLRFNLLSYN